MQRNHSNKDMNKHPLVCGWENQVIAPTSSYPLDSPSSHPWHVGLHSTSGHLSKEPQGVLKRAGTAAGADGGVEGDATGMDGEDLRNDGGLVGICEMGEMMIAVLGKYGELVIDFLEVCISDIRIMMVIKIIIIMITIAIIMMIITILKMIIRIVVLVIRNNDIGPRFS